MDTGQWTLLSRADNLHLHEFDSNKQSKKFRKVWPYNTRNDEVHKVDAFWKLFRKQFQFQFK